MITKRLSLSLLAIGCIALVVSAGSFALFRSSTVNENNTFATGTVSLEETATTIVDITDATPGDTNVSAGSFTVKYTGSLPAWMRMQAALSESATGQLLSCQSDKFSVAVSDGSTLINLMNTNKTGNIEVPIQKDGTATYTVNYSLALNTDDVIGAGEVTCQGKSASLAMTVQAVQAKHNGWDGTLPFPTTVPGGVTW